ncbi:MAG: SCP2 domain-containing protein [Neisseria sp.]|nr:SCP2 domain-containing protein [Neisseria sp.]
MLTLSVFNHLIGQNPDVAAVLAGYNGIVLRIRAAGLQVHGRFDEHGLLRPTGREADAVLVFHRSALDKLLGGKMPDVGDVAIEGDEALGFNLLMLLGRLRYHAGRDLQKLFGEAAAGNIGRGARKAGRALQSLGRGLAGSDEGGGEVSPEAFDDLAGEVARLREDVERLYAMLEKHERDW